MLLTVISSQTILEAGRNYAIFHEPIAFEEREKNHKKKTAVSHQLAVNLLLAAGFFSSKTHQIHLTYASFDNKKTRNWSVKQVWP